MLPSLLRGLQPEFYELWQGGRNQSEPDGGWSVLPDAERADLAPPQLSLTLGLPAVFATFTAGVAREYTAATTLTVTSTAGEATLSLAEPGHMTNGAYALAQPLRVTLSMTAWTAPVSNDVVDVGLAQAVGSSDPLRTGSYSNTITFTLSTNTP